MNSKYYDIIDSHLQDEEAINAMSEPQEFNYRDAIIEKKCKNFYQTLENTFYAYKLSHNRSIGHVSRTPEKQLFFGSSFNRKKKPFHDQERLQTSEEKNGKNNDASWDSEKDNPLRKVKKFHSSKSLQLRGTSERTKHKIKDKMLSFFEASKGKKGFRHNKVDFYFITLTFINKVNDKLAISVLNKFLTVLKNKYGNFGYIWVAEKQQNGNIHYHMIADKRFNLYYLNSLWTVQQINSGIRNYEQEYECLDKEKVTINDLHSAKSWQTIQKYLNPVDIKPVKTIEGISAYLTSYVTKNDSKFYCSSWHCNRQVSRIFTSSAINRDVFDITCDSNKNRIKTIKGKEYINTTYFGQYCIINTIYNKSYYRRYLDEMRLINRYILLKEREIKIDHDFVYKYNLVDNQQYRERFKVNLLEFQN